MPTSGTSVSLRMALSSRAFLAVLETIVFLVLASPTIAQEPSSRRNEPELVTHEMINEALAAAKGAKGLDEATLTSIQNICDQAAADLNESERLAVAEAEFEGMIRMSEEDVKPDQPVVAPISAPPDASVEQLEAELRNLSARLKKTRKTQRELAAEPARRQERLKEIPDEVAETETRLSSLVEQLEVPTIPGEAEQLTVARDLGLRAAGQMSEQRLKALQLEQDAYLSATEFVKLSLESKTQEVKQLEQQVEELQGRIKETRQREIKDLASETNAKAEKALEEGDFEELKPFAQYNLDLASRLRDIGAKVTQASEAATEASNAQKRLEDDLLTAQNRVETVKLSRSMGVMLRKDKAKLTTLRKKFVEAGTFEDKVQMRVDQYEFEDLRAELEDPAEAVEAALAEMKLNEMRVKQLRAPLTVLFENRKEILGRLIEMHGKLIEALNKKDTAENSYAKTSQRYTNFINQHILWIRSAPPIGYGETKSWADSIRWLLDPSQWRSVGTASVRSVTQHLPLTLPWIALAVLMLAIHPTMSKGIFAAGLEAEKGACRNFTPTSTALFRTVVKSLMWPSILYVAGKIILIGNEGSTFSLALGFALTQVAVILLPIELMRQACRGKGLAEAHSEWHAHSCKAMKRDLDWFIPTASIFLLVTLTLRNYGEENWNGTLGRASMCILLVLCAIALYRMMRPGALFFRRVSESEQTPWSTHFGYLRLILLPGIPLVLLIFALAGYNYTAIELGKVWIQTIAVAICLLVLYIVALRFLLVRRRRLRYEQLVEQREQMRKAAEETNEQQIEPPAAALAVELKTESGMDITDVSRQARELTGVLFGLVAVVILWNLWQEFLPATKILDEWRLWPTATGENGQDKDWVSVRDVLVSLLMFTLTFLGVRNIPGLLELLLLKQLPLDAGSRYAVSTIVRYVITVAGIILALSFLKVPWTKYSWLVAAISVGLGFGLQEIVANFVSGLILLLERPVRVGDVVTIDGTTGIVSRIQMRATTITNWDNQELVVPNKDLITGKLMNWTLSSVINRVSVGVGVAYGTDPEQVKEILLKVAAENPDVLDDPAPLVSFEEFGDSSLNFKLRYCITTMSKRIMIIHAINSSIYKHLTEAGIEIPFPQRDVNFNLPEGFTGRIDWPGEAKPQ